MTRQETSPDKSISRYDTELFTIRMWREALNDHFEWRGKVLHGGSHKEYYFRNLNALTAFIVQILSEGAPSREIKKK